MKRRTIYIALVMLVVAIIAGYNYMYQDHRDIQKEQAAYTGDASGFNQLYLQSNKETLLNKTVVISGIVTAVEAGGATIDDAVFASFLNQTELPKLNDKVTLKGRCIGYDELFELVTIDQAGLVD